MTKFIDNSKVIEKDNRVKTSFKYSIDEDGLCRTTKTPDSYDEVEYLGINGHGQDSITVFRARNKGASTWGFFTGVKGYEFDSYDSTI